MSHILYSFLDKTSRQRLALLKIFQANSGKSITLEEIMEKMKSEDYRVFLKDGDEFIEKLDINGLKTIPTILRDRIKELMKIEVIEMSEVKSKSNKYKLKNYSLNNLFDLFSISKENDLVVLAEWKANLSKYKELPLAGIMNILDESSRNSFTNDKKKDETFKIIDFETPFLKDQKLIDDVQKLYSAICKKQFLEIHYKGHYQSYREPEEHSLINFMPYILKESHGQWYVVGKCHPDEDYRSIPVNRIIGDIIVDDTREFKRDSINPAKHWDGCVGITKIGSPLNISFKVKNGNSYNNIDYIKMTPIVKEHQKVVELEDKWFKVTLEKVYMGPELVRIIRSFGRDNICDVSPAWLQEDLWESGNRGELSFSILFDPIEDPDKWLSSVVEQLNIKPEQENSVASKNIKKSPNKKGWYQVNLKNVLINSSLWNFKNMIEVKYTKNRLWISKNPF